VDEVCVIFGQRIKMLARLREDFEASTSGLSGCIMSIIIMSHILVVSNHKCNG